MGTCVREHWKPVKIDGEDWPYEVSVLGNIRRSQATSGTQKNRILKPLPTPKNYLMASLNSSGIIERHYVHHLVLTAFVGPCPDGYETNHIDGDKRNNHIENLEWVLHAQNMRHASEKGLMKRGSNHYHSKLTAPDVQTIRKLRKRGHSAKKLGKIFNVNPVTIYDILEGRTWKWLKEG